MRYFFISDTHGCEPGLVDIALKNKGFDKETDTLVMLGDLFDRGKYARQILSYFLDIPHFIPVIGNHDWRDFALLLGADYPADFDKYNEVGTTFCSLLGWPPERCKNSKLHIAYQLLMDKNPYNQEAIKNVGHFFYYMRNAVWGIEFPDFIAVHGWMPIDAAGHLIPVADATQRQWVDAIWCDTQDMIDFKRYPDKPMVIGHWGSWRLYLYEQGIGTNDLGKYLDSLGEDWVSKVNFNIYKNEHLTAIDGSVFLSNQVNVYVYDCSDDVDPIIYGRNGLLPLSEWRAKNGE